MTVAADLFGTAYLDAESFREHAELFGVGMSIANYPVPESPSPATETKLNRVLQAASRAVDAFCGREFTAGDFVEKHILDMITWRFSVNNGPVSTISACVIRLGIESTITIPTGRLYIDNQRGYVEIARDMQTAIVASGTPTSINEPTVEVTYKSLQTVPSPVKLATGYQAGHMINNGFVDAAIPANFGALDLEGLVMNNKKGPKSSEEAWVSSFSPEAERLLTPFKSFVVG